VAQTKNQNNRIPEVVLLKNKIHPGLVCYTNEDLQIFVQELSLVEAHPPFIWVADISGVDTFE
jgi:hypothetical protein